MKALASGAIVEVYDQLDSTSLEARRRAEAGEVGPIWFVALTQIAGYGRRGRGWVHAKGDFAATLLMDASDAPSESLGQVSFSAALALADMIESLAPHAPLSLKWPNDVLLDEGKVAGILLEHLRYKNAARLMIGIGVNIVSAPEGLNYKTARLLDFAARAPAPEAFLASLDRYFQHYYAQWRKDGFAEIRRQWLTRAVGLGEEITVRLPHEEICGRFETIDENGALILRLGDGNRIISAGEVFFGSPS